MGALKKVCHFFVEAYTHVSHWVQTLRASLKVGYVKIGWQEFVLLVIISASVTAALIGSNKSYNELASVYQPTVAERDEAVQKYQDLDTRFKDLFGEYAALERQTETLVASSSRSHSPMRFRITAYSAGPESTGKHPGDKNYGITASGRPVETWSTCAADSNLLPIGSLVYIPYFSDQPNKGMFIVEDTGSAVRGLHLDVYMEDVDAARAFGLRYLDVIVLRYGW